MLMLTPCGEKAGAISVCVCVDANPLCACVHVDLCVPMCVCTRALCVCVRGCTAEGGHNEMGD